MELIYLHERRPARRDLVLGARLMRAAGSLASILGEGRERGKVSHVKAELARGFFPMIVGWAPTLALAAFVEHGWVPIVAMHAAALVIL